MKKEIFETQLNERLQGLQEKWNNNPTVLNYLNRGLCQCYNNPQDGILVLGINPSYPQKTEEQRKLNGVTFGYSFSTASNRYFDSLRLILGELYDKTGYLDLFPIKESVQKKFSEDIIANEACLPMVVDLVANAQQEIEALKPHIIILKNKQLAPFMGFVDKFTWMGYNFEEVENPLNDKNIILYRITGLKSLDNVAQIKTTNLCGTLVLFYGLYDARHEKTCPNRILQNGHIQKLWDMAQD